MAWTSWISAAATGVKAVEFAKLANRVVGVEPVTRHIELATQYREWLGIENVEFKLCGPATIPCANDEFDMVVSHDVIEHVENPERSMLEIHPILKPADTRS